LKVIFVRSLMAVQHASLATLTHFGNSIVCLFTLRSWILYFGAYRW
jgi:hypothetical protein